MSNHIDVVFWEAAFENRYWVLLWGEGGGEGGHCLKSAGANGTPFIFFQQWI